VFLGKYIDGRCVYYRKPFFDSGTLGAKASVQVAVPFLTESYSSVVDPPEPSTPIDMIINFPQSTDDAILWAKHRFTDLFTESAQQAKEFVCSPKEFTERIAKTPEYQQNKIVENLRRILGQDRPKNLVDCIEWVNFYR
jgi:ubiquitin-activating enzyme E1